MFYCCTILSAYVIIHVTTCDYTRDVFLALAVDNHAGLSEAQAVWANWQYHSQCQPLHIAPKYYCRGKAYHG